MCSTHQGQVRHASSTPYREFAQRVLATTEQHYGLDHQVLYNPPRCPRSEHATVRFVVCIAQQAQDSNAGGV